MARYGIDFYGGAVYGSPSFADYDATPLNAMPYASGENQLQWSIASGDWTRFRLVRNAYGWPVHEDDGRVLLDLNMGPSATPPLDAPVDDYIDTDLQPGRLYYYSIFVLAIDDTGQYSDWRRAADATTISVGAYNYTERMLDLLPEVYWVDPNDPSGRNDSFVRFLSIFGFQLDYIRSQYETLRSVYDPDKVAAGLLGPLGDMFGVDYEPEIGAKQHRALVRNAVYIARRKATLLGTNTLVSAFTGWDAEISTGVNLMLDYNESSAEEWQGHWRAAALCTVSYRPSDTSIAAWQSGVFTNKQSGMLLMTSTGVGNMGMGCGWRRPVSAGIPVEVGTAYTVSAYVRPVTTGRANWLGIRWCGPRGATISETTGSPTTSVLNTWTRITATGTAPAGTVYAVPFVNVTVGGISEQHVVDAVQFEQGSSATAFQEARDVRIVLTADRINELPNPSAEVNTTGWSVSNAALSRDSTVAFSGTLNATTPTTGSGAVNAASFKVISAGGTLTPGPEVYPSTGEFPSGWTGAFAPAIVSTPTGTSGMPVDPTTDYAFSAYCYGSVNVQLAMTWYDIGGTFISTSTGQIWPWVNGGWIRPECEATSPDNAAFLSVSVLPQFTDVNQICWFDQVLVERIAEVRPYFDASQYGSRQADYIWEGTAHQSRSHYYFNRTAKTFRLDELLDDYLMLGSTHTLLVAQPFQRETPAPNEDTVYGLGAFGAGPYD